MIFKSKLIKSLLIITILITAVKQILLTQVIYALSSGTIASSSPTSGDEPTNILPTDKDEVRSYKWKDQEVTTVGPPSLKFVSWSTSTQPNVRFGGLKRL